MSRRFKGRHWKVQANPNAKPVPPIVLDDSNGVRQPMGYHLAKRLNSRAFVVAGSSTARSTPPEPQSRPAPSAPALEPPL